MWIRSQNKRELVNVIRVQISYIIGDENHKANIWGYLSDDSLISKNKVLLGNYKTFEHAEKELDEIQRKIIENPNSLYQMR